MSYNEELNRMYELLEEQQLASAGHENAVDVSDYIKNLNIIMASQNEEDAKIYLINVLPEIYNIITNESIIKYKNYKHNKNLEELKKNDLSLTNSISEKKHESMTNKRLVEIKINKARKIQYNLNVLKIALIVSGCFVVVPILNKLGILNKTMSLIIWGFCVLILVLVILYFVYIHISDRNKNNFNKFNFQNPNSELIAKSKVNVDLSDKEYAKCKAFEEVKQAHDPDTISNFSITDYLTPGVDENNQCST